MKAEPTTKELIAMLYERCPEFFNRPQPAQEPVAWRNAAIRLGEELSSVGPDGYYDMTAEQWFDWAMEQEPRGKNSLAQPAQEPVDNELFEAFAKKNPSPDQRPWVGLTEDDKKQIAREADYHWEMTAGEYAERIGQLTENKLKEKNFD